MIITHHNDTTNRTPDSDAEAAWVGDLGARNAKSLAAVTELVEGAATAEY